MAQKYAIIDIETTGGLAKRDRITEIAIVVSDGKKIIDQYETLVNPGISIPYNITRITGITDDMVIDAPKFYEVAKKVVEMTEDTVFVAHNVQFDYSFIQMAFSNLGYSFSKRRLCTVKMSRKAFPGLKSYSLGNLIKHFKIEVKDRHRALEDAVATTKIFHMILEKKPAELNERQLISKSAELSKLPEGITLDYIKTLPTQCGVYYMSDENKEIVYIGKSINIQKRIKQHFSKVDRKTGKMLQKVRSIHYELTGSELAALIKEAVEIKELKPEINKALRRSDYPYGVYIDTNPNGYKIFKSAKITEAIESKYEIISKHGSARTAKSFIKRYTSAFGLCKQINGIEKNTGGACFEYSMRKCLGACIQLEESDSYNERVLEAAELTNVFTEPNFIIVDHGRDLSEKAVFLIEEGVFRGYGYISSEDVFLGIEEIKESINYINTDKQITAIVRNQLSSNTNLNIIKF